MSPSLRLVFWETTKAYGGRCGVCRFEAICGGCRARAYAETGSFLAEEPFCTYRPELEVHRREPRGSRPQQGVHS